MTKTEIDFDLIDTTAKSESELTVTNINSISILNDLKQEDIDVFRYATLEKNTHYLDGSQNILSRNETYTNTAYCSSRISGKNGSFSSPIGLQIDFETYHTSAGITLVFGEESYASSILAYYYQDNDLILQKVYYPDSRTFWLEENTVELYNRIVLVFYGTNIPYRFLKIEQILYGLIKVFDDVDIMTATTSHNINLLSSELEVNKLSFTINDQDLLFNITNEEGLYNNVQSNQKLAVYETKDDVRHFIGTFYLTNWKNTQVARASFEAQDSIGLLDNYKFYGGMYSNKSSTELIEEILEIAGIDNYVLEVEDVDINGYMPISTCREALQQILFVIGAVCNTSNEETLKIYKTQKEEVDFIIDDENKLYDTTQVTMNQKISAIEISLYSYGLGTELQELSKGNLDGTSIIEFSEPIDPSTIVGTNCTIEEVGVNYAIITSTAGTEYILEGYTYEETEVVKTVQNADLETIKENVLKIKDDKLVTKDNFTDILSRVFEFYSGTYKTQVQVLAQGEITGDYISVNTFNGARLMGNISEVSCNLAGGYISTITIDNAILKSGRNEWYVVNDNDELFASEQEQIRGMME